MVKNGTETDMDCGGGTCPACTTGHVCLIPVDCESSVCVGGICTSPTCNDMVKNGTETDIDCGGGTCSPCASGRSCLWAGDCISGTCNGGFCQ
jgi:hypothetical protein